MSVAISVTGLAKRYRLVPVGQRHDTLRDAISAAFRNVARIGSKSPARAARGEFWALRDLSFELRQGEVLGIIGGNGAGKSTLLKILSRITPPSQGAATVRGRVGSLLEVGTGFNWELSGRENIYLNGAILGMRRAEITHKFDEIVAFAEVEPFIDTPVKHYSSGMYLRLAFAVAAHLEPEILIIDEVLAVGDAGFQKKCLGRMGAASREGRTVLFVSHNMLAIESLSHRVLWIDNGSRMMEGAPREVVSAYLGMSMPRATERVWQPPDTGNGVHLCRASVRSATGTAADELDVHTPILLECDVLNRAADAHVSPVFNVFNEQEIMVFTTSPPDVADWRDHPTPVGLSRFTCSIPADLLNDGLYRLEVAVRRNYEPVMQHTESLVFAVRDTPRSRVGWYADWPGVVRPRLEWMEQLVGAEHNDVR